MDPYMRRATDPDHIEEMIAEESDPKDRAFLLVLNNINKALVQNTDTIREIAKKLDAHVAKFESHTAIEDAMLNQGKGAWRVTAWVIGVVQVVGLAVWADSRAEIEAMHKEIQSHEVRVTVLEKQDSRRPNKPEVK